MTVLTGDLRVIARTPDSALAVLPVRTSVAAMKFYFPIFGHAESSVCFTAFGGIKPLIRNRCF